MSGLTRSSVTWGGIASFSAMPSLPESARTVVDRIGGHGPWAGRR
jgi:hypothetical protein